MVSGIVTRPFVVHEVMRWPAGRPRPLGEFELRTASLRIAASLLGVSVANLDCVLDARAQLGDGGCPDCHAVAMPAPLPRPFEAWRAHGR